MQGALHEIDSATICRLISTRQYTGELWLHTTDSYGNHKNWLVYFTGGKVAYGCRPDGKLDRLADFLEGLKLMGLNLEDALTSLWNGRLRLGIALREYEKIWLLLQGQVLEPNQAIKILRLMTEEVFFDVLRLRSGKFYFRTGQSLQPQLMALDTLTLLAQVQAQVQQWYRIFPHVPDIEHSPKFTYPVDADSSAFELLTPLEPWLELETNPSLRQIARRRHLSPIHIVKEVYEAIASGVVCLLPPIPPKSSPVCPHILCIDSSPSACGTINYLLTNAGYRVSTCHESLTALATVFKLRPHLILCSTAMPDLDGYQLCAMLKQSRNFQTVPIVLMLSEWGDAEQRQALICGGSGHLVKPFLPAQLLSIVAQNLQMPTRLGILDKNSEETIS